MDITDLDGRALTETQAEQLAAMQNAVLAVEAPHLEQTTAEKVRLDYRYGWDGHGTEHLLVATSPTGDIIGSLELDWPQWDNLDAAGLDLRVDPAYDLDVVSDALLDVGLRINKEAGRTKLFSDAWVGTAREAYWRRVGFEVAARMTQRRLYPAKLDWATLDTLHAASLDASQEYDVINLHSPTPDEYIERYLALHLAMNDAPMDDLDVEDLVWTVERHRDHEEAVRNRRIRFVSLVAQRRSDGAFGGHTVIAIEDGRPWLGFQEDTAVVAGHRGHRLGIRLKIEMLKLIVETEPQVRQIDTWNADSNTHMLAVNEALGCEIVGRLVESQKKI